MGKSNGAIRSSENFVQSKFQDTQASKKSNKPRKEELVRKFIIRRTFQIISGQLWLTG